MQKLSGESTISEVYPAPKDIQLLRAFFSSYRLYKKQTVQIKNRIHSVLKEALYGFTQEEIFGNKSRQMIRQISDDPELSFHLNFLMDSLERVETDIEALKKRILVYGQRYMRDIEILTSMKGVSVFIALAIIADIIDVSRFKNSKTFTSYLRSAPRVSSSNTSLSIRGTNKKGRKLSATLITQSLNHVLAASPKLQSWYERLAQYKKPGLVRTGLRRKVFAEIYQMLKKGEYHYGRDPRKHEAKMNEYRKLLEQHEKQQVFDESA
jgi:transposase